MIHTKKNTHQHEVFPFSSTTSKPEVTVACNFEQLSHEVQHLCRTSSKLPLNSWPRAPEPCKDAVCGKSGDKVSYSAVYHLDQYR